MPRIVTYNVRRCVGLDRGQSPQRIARVLRELRPDVVAIQEIESRPSRSGRGDQVAALANELGMASYFFPPIAIGGYRYGDALFTARPSRLVKAARLPRAGKLEPRGAIWIAVEVDGTEIQVINTHLGLGGRERVEQAKALLGPDWLDHPDCRAPAILVGDLNATPSSRCYRKLSESRLRDAQTIGSEKPRGTFPTRLPVLRIDHVFVSPDLRVVSTLVSRSPLARIASDHLPLAVEFEVARA